MSYSADAESACTSKAPLSSGTTCGSSRGGVCGRYGGDVGEMWGRYWGRCGGDTGHDLRELAEGRVERLDRRLKRRMQEPVHSWACEETPFTPAAEGSPAAPARHGLCEAECGRRRDQPSRVSTARCEHEGVNTAPSGCEYGTVRVRGEGD